MAVAWTDITNAQVSAGAALTTALATAWRDNPEGIAQRASGAPKIFGVPYDYQEFTANGTWTKPSNAESGDKVIVHVVAGGGAGGRSAVSPQGGMGGGGAMHKFDDIDDLGATEAVLVGAGGVATSGSGGNGGNSSFGTAASGSDIGNFLQSIGGQGGDNSTVGRVNDYENYGYVRHSNSNVVATGAGEATSNGQYGGSGGGEGNRIGGSSISGGGGGGGGDSAVGVTGPAPGGVSLYAGRGGNATDKSGAVTDYAIDGEFPGGGGGAVDADVTGDTVGGEGADGVVRVWCIKEG